MTLVTEELFRQMVRQAVREGVAQGLERAGYPRPRPQLEVLKGGRVTAVAHRPRRSPRNLQAVDAS